MKQFNDKCIDFKNKMKGFWNFIKGHNYVNSPSQVFNPENHSEMLFDASDINNALKSHFSSIGPDRVDTENNIFQCEVEAFVSKIDQNLTTSDTRISLNIHRENIKSVLESCRKGLLYWWKSEWISEIWGKYSIKFIARSIYENYWSWKNPRRLAQGNHKAYPQERINVWPR